MSHPEHEKKMFSPAETAVVDEIIDEEIDEIIVEDIDEVFPHLARQPPQFEKWFNGKTLFEIFEEQKIIDGQNLVEFIRSHDDARMQIGNGNTMYINVPEIELDDDISREIEAGIPKRLQLGDNNTIVLRSMKLRLVKGVTDEPTDDIGLRCTVCEKNLVIIVVVGCGHTVCHGCSEKVVTTKRCPICEIPAEKLMKLRLQMFSL